MPVPTQISDGHRIASIDHLNNTLMATLVEHAHIHHGHTYRADNVADVSANDALSISFKTPTGKQLHLEYVVKAEFPATFSLYENSEITGGSTCNILNANRNYPDASGTSDAKKDATITTTNATTIISDYIGYESPHTTASLSARHEWVLKENTMYSFELDNEADKDNQLFLRLDWYETEPETG